ncbi:Senescence-associated carboxylesterase 101, partial [Linum grandiflorum]
PNYPTIYIPSTSPKRTFIHPWGPPIQLFIYNHHNSTPFSPSQSASILSKVIPFTMNQQPQIFDSGLELASSVANSDLLPTSWSSVTSLYSETKANPHVASASNLSPRFRMYQHEKCTVVAFVTSPIYSPGQGGGDSELLVSSEELRKQTFPQLDFLCSKANPSFAVHNAAVTCFASLFSDLQALTSQLIVTKPNEASLKSTLIVTGHSLGGSIASLFTLWLLDRMSSKKPSKKLPLCITFGSPLMGDRGLQRAISQRSTWNSCFLHAIASGDRLPSFFLQTNNKGYKPFGTFMFCSGDGKSCDCVEDPEIVSILLSHKANGFGAGSADSGSGSVDGYGKLVESLKSGVVCRGSCELGGPVGDSLQAGIVLQLQSIGISPHQQQQNQSIKKMAEEMEKKTKFTALRKRSATEQSRKVQETKVKMAYFEWYKKDSKINRGTCYYDSYKSQTTIADMEIAKHKKFLTNYWRDLVEDAESRPQKEGSFFRTTFLYGGTTYRRMVEPLDIAEFYREGRTNYTTQGRSNHYVLLEKWLEDDAKGKKATKKDKKHGPGDNLTEDSCFWANVEEALIRVRMVKKGGGSGEAKKWLVEFSGYVMGQIENYGVDSEIFFVESSFMIWWKEFQEVLGIVGSGDSQLVQYMKSGNYRYYGSTSV